MAKNKVFATRTKMVNQSFRAFYFNLFANLWNVIRNLQCLKYVFTKITHTHRSISGPSLYTWRIPYESNRNCRRISEFQLSNYFRYCGTRSMGSISCYQCWRWGFNSENKCYSNRGIHQIIIQIITVAVKCSVNNLFVVLLNGWRLFRN